MANNNIIFNVENIFSIGGFLNEGEYYNIPEYQRGYKWSSQSIKKLLNDINSFETYGNSEKFYCLQNITIVEDKEKNYYNVVDGQQRLTTLSILLAYLEQYDLIKGKLRYSVRDETQAFLDNYIYQNRKEEWESWSSDWNTFLQSEPEYDFQDIFYMFTAYNTIKKWFNNQGTNGFLKKLLHNVDIIVNQPKTKDETKLFANLNGDKVSLDGADIVRALLITHVAKEKSLEILDESKSMVMINEQRVRTGMNLDDITRWWTIKDHIDYFKPFIKGIKSAEGEVLKFDENDNAINRLYKLYVASLSCSQNGVAISLNFFENPKESSFSHLMENIIWLQRLIMSWYNDKVLYHLVPFCIIYCGKTFGEMVVKWKDCTRKSFENYLKKIISDWILSMTDQRLFSEDLLKKDGQKENNEGNEDNDKIISLAEDSRNLGNEENWYGSPYLKGVLILVDIIDVCKSDSNEKLPPLYFTSFHEDEEHIFPQTPIEKISQSRYANQTKKLKKYIEIVNKELKDNGEAAVVFDETNIHWDDEKWREELRNKYNDLIIKYVPINSLGNMALLNESVNRGYGNDFFTEKRIDVMKAYRLGGYIRPHVMDAFNKQFLERKDIDDDFSRMQSWKKEDILARREYMVKTICNFLNIQLKDKYV